MKPDDEWNKEFKDGVTYEEMDTIPMELLREFEDSALSGFSVTEPAELDVWASDKDAIKREYKKK